MGVETANGIASMTADVDFAYNMAKWLHQSFDTHKSTLALAVRERPVDR